jgi:predicted SprT family Zn-dependent metalloprotease
MHLTEKELDLYARMTLKQWDLSDISIKWADLPRSLGLADPWNKEITLSTRLLQSFSLFELTLLHEMAHILDYQERGTFKKNGRNSHHGPSFKKWCRKLGISTKTKVDVSKYGLTPSYKKS